MDQSLGWLNCEDDGAASLATQESPQPACASRSSSSVKSTPAGQLPPPLTTKMMEAVLRELPEGTRNAVSSCYGCLAAKRFASDEFLRLLASVASQSPTLTRIFEHAPSAQVAAGRPAASPRVKSEGGAHASVVPAIGVDASAPPRFLPNVARSFDPAEAMPPPGLPPPSAASAAAAAFLAGKPRCCDAKTGEVATTWGLAERRRKEVRRRQLQRFEGSDPCRLGLFLLDTTQRLAKQLPAGSKAQLLHAVRQFHSGVTTPEHFAERIQQLVDAHGIMLALDESTQRSPPKKGGKAAAAGVGTKRQNAAGGSAAPAKRAKNAPAGKKKAATAAPPVRPDPAAGVGVTGLGKRSPHEESTTCSAGSASDYGSSYGSPGIFVLICYFLLFVALSAPVTTALRTVPQEQCLNKVRSAVPVYIISV